MAQVTVYSFDGKDYFLVTKIDSYLYLSNEKDSRDMMIRKEDPNDETILLPLDNDEEFEKALLLLVKQKHEQEEL